MPKKDQTYDYLCFTEITYEFSPSTEAEAETEKKIRRRLKYYGLESYDQTRVDYIRKLRHDLYAEISLGKNSEYYTYPHSEFAGLIDFNIDQLNIDYLKKYDQIREKDMSLIINFAIYIFYLR